MKFFIFLTLFIVSNYAYSEKLLNIYEDCKNNVNCSDGCKKSPLKIQFLVDKNQRIVKSITTGNGQIISSRIFENCKIFDSNNFDCSSSIANKAFFEHVMTNGIYSEHWRNADGSSSSIGGNEIRICAR